MKTIVVITLIAFSFTAPAQSGIYISPAKLDSIINALSSGREGLVKAYTLEERLKAREWQLGTRNGQLRDAQQTIDSLRKALALAVAAKKDYDQSGNSYEKAYTELQGVNAILEKQTKRDFTLSIGPGYGLAGDKNGVGPRFGLMVFFGFTFARF